MTVYYNIPGNYIQEFPAPELTLEWRVATKDDIALVNNPSPTPESISAIRYDKEVAGIVWQGFGIATDRSSQNKVSQELMAIDRGLRADGKGWKCLDLQTGQVVFRPTNNDEMRQIGDAVYQYVSDCFEREEALLAMGAAVTADDLAQGWPANG